MIIAYCGGGVQLIISQVRLRSYSSICHKFKVALRSADNLQEIPPGLYSGMWGWKRLLWEAAGGILTFAGAVEYLSARNFALCTKRTLSERQRVCPFCTRL